MKISNILGVDVSKDHLDICWLKSDGCIVLETKIKNSLTEIRKFIKLIEKEGANFSETLFCMEHTGIYNNLLLNALHKKAYHVWLESARQIILSGGMQRGKNDKVDAYRIAYYALRNSDKIRLWKPKREELQKLDALLKNRKRMLKVKNQLAVSLRESKRFISKEIATLNERVNRKALNAIKSSIEMIESEIKTLLSSDSVLKTQSSLAKSIPGVGDIIAATVIVKTNEFINYNDGRKFACQAGVAPFDHSSGSSIRGRTRVSHMADKSLKTLLHLAAMAAIKKQGEIKNYYERKVAEGKNKMSILNAIRNKIIQRIFAVVNRGTPYSNFNNLVFA